MVVWMQGCLHACLSGPALTADLVAAEARYSASELKATRAGKQSWFPKKASDAHTDKSQSEQRASNALT